MNDTQRKKDAPKRSITLSDVIKLIGVLAVFFPLMNAILQYRQSIQNKMDENFRSIVKQLSSEKKAERLAAASNLGTFISKGGEFYEATIDILVNKLSIELDYNVLNAIRGSLEKIEKDDYGEVISKLLDIERNFFIQRSALRNWHDKAKEAYEESRLTFLKRSDNIDKKRLDAESEVLDSLKTEMNLKWQIFYDREKDFNELEMHQRVIFDFLEAFMRITKYLQLERLIFFRNKLNDVSLIDMDLSKSEIQYSLFERCDIFHSKFNNSNFYSTEFFKSKLLKTSFVESTIISTFFAQSGLINVDFTNTTFKNVSFMGSNLTGAIFKNTEGLKPIHFYKAVNVDKAIFDPEFKEELNEKLESITVVEFIEYVNNIVDMDGERKRNYINQIKGMVGL